MSLSGPFSPAQLFPSRMIYPLLVQISIWIGTEAIHNTCPPGQCLLSFFSCKDKKNNAEKKLVGGIKRPLMPLMSCKRLRNSLFLYLHQSFINVIYLDYKVWDLLSALPYSSLSKLGLETPLLTVIICLKAFKLSAHHKFIVKPFANTARAQKTPSLGCYNWEMRNGLGKSVFRWN